MATIRVFNHHLHSGFYRLVMVDSIVFFAAFYLGAYLYYMEDLASFYASLGHMAPRAAVFSLVTVLCLMAMGMYQPRMREGASGVLLRTAGAFVLLTLAMTVIFYLFPTLYLWRGIFLNTVVVVFLASLATRLTFTSLTNLEQLKSKVLVYGAGEAASAIPKTMRRKADRTGFTIVGYVPAHGEVVEVDSEPVLDADEPLSELAQRLNIDRIVVATNAQFPPESIDEFIACRAAGIEIMDLVNFFEQEAGKILVDLISPEWLVYNDGFKRKKTSMFLKRCFDLSASFVLLMATWPFMLITMLAIWIEDGFSAPVIFRQNRVGANGKVFEVLKFRSMTVDAEGDGRARWATDNDSRVTRVGAIIRKIRVDELPQILNVLTGDMAFIGPRPERPEFVGQLNQRIPYYDIRHFVKPGITGWAQLCYPYGASENDAKQKLQFDLYYVKNHSLFLDFMIMLNTVEVVLFGKGAR